MAPTPDALLLGLLALVTVGLLLLSNLYAIMFRHRCGPASGRVPPEPAAQAYPLKPRPPLQPPPGRPLL